MYTTCVLHENSINFILFSHVNRWIVFLATPGTSCPSLRLSPVINLFSNTLIQFLLGMNINVVE